jgi:peptidoglycan/LPS O-acetylase OafA/YrhL
MSRINILQGGRALAAFGVAAYHLSITMGLPRYGGDPVFSSYTHLWDRGVDFFFVLSGFIILYVHHADIGRPERLGPYLRKRFMRVFPIYWVYTIPLALLLMLGFGTDAKYPDNLGGWITSITLIRFTSDTPPLPTSWTLFHEVAFYAVFALLIWQRRVGMAAVALAAAICLATLQFPSGTERTALNVYTSAYNLHFLLGMFSYWLYRREVSGSLLALTGAALCAAALNDAIRPHEWSPLMVGTGFAFLLAGLARLELKGKLKVPALLVLIGDASYSLYLLHEHLEGLVLKVLIKTQLQQALGGPITFLLTLCGATALSCLAYMLIEKPLLAQLQRRKHSGRTPGPLPAASPQSGSV